jgi:hypothetical protein
MRSGKEFSELDKSFDLLRGTRPVDWALDIVGSGDNGKQSDGQARIEELYLCTPQGEVSLSISEPYTAFQLKRGTMDLLGWNRIIQAQIIGRLDDSETGRCTAYIWDVQEQRLYGEWQTYITNFAAWREGIIPIGALNLEPIGLKPMEEGIR